MPDMGRGITAPASGANIITGATEMQLLGSTTVAAIDDLEALTEERLSEAMAGVDVDAALAAYRAAIA